MSRHRLFLNSNQADLSLINNTRTDALEFDLVPAITTGPGERMYVRLQSTSIPMASYQINSYINKINTHHRGLRQR
jgi:hypothetical protein